MKNTLVHCVTLNLMTFIYFEHKISNSYFSPSLVMGHFDIDFLNFGHHFTNFQSPLNYLAGILIFWPAIIWLYLLLKMKSQTLKLPMNYRLHKGKKAK